MAPSEADPMPPVKPVPRVDDASMGNSDDDDEEDDGLQYLLGFAEPPQDGPITKPGVAPSAAPRGGAAPSLLRHRFPSKAGGSPAWLDPLRLPPRSALACPRTGSTYRFLLQVYAPDEAAEDGRAFHRAVFLFVSPEGDRLARGERGSAVAFRCQLPRNNPYYGYEPAGAGEVVPRPLQVAELELALERDPWRVARREAAIAAAGGGFAGADADEDDNEGGPEPFREMELVVEPEPSDDGSDLMEEVARQQQQQGAGGAGAAAGAMPVDGGGGGGNNSAAATTPTTAAAAAEAAAASGGVGRATVARLLADYQRRALEEGGAPDDEELPPSLMNELEEALGRERAAFASFQARVARAPAQVLRYCFSEGSSALWPSASRVPGPGDVPPCGRCGGPRRFEFQVMPQLLSYLGVDEDDPSAPDWGTIAVYSCAASCAPPAAAEAGDGASSAYSEEFVWVQPPATA